MYIDKLTCLNWGNLPCRTYQFGPVTLITGGTGSGKSTMGDAIQTVMTAAKRNLFSYNPGQEEATQGGRGGKIPRTLESYILGADDNRYARPDGISTGYVAVSFVPSADEPSRPGFTAVVGARAYLESAPGAARTRRAAKLDGMRLLIVEGHLLTDADFVLSNENQMLKLVQLDAVYDHLRTRYGTAVSDFSDNKKTYLSALYGHLRGRSSVNSEQAERAAKAFSRFMAYKPTHLVNEFVRDDVLEPVDIAADVGQIRGFIREVNDLRRESVRLATNIDRLKAAKHWGDQLENAWRRQQEDRLLLALKGEHDAEKEKTDIEASVSSLEAEGVRLVDTLSTIRSRQQALEDQRLDLKARINQNEAARTRETCEQQIRSDLDAAGPALSALTAALGYSGRNIEASLQLGGVKERIKQHPYLNKAFSQAEQAVAEIKGFDPSAIGRLAEKVLRASEPASADCQRLADALAGIDDAQQMIKLTVLDEQGLAALAGELFGKVGFELSDLMEQEQDLRARVETIETRQQVRYPHHVERAIEAISQAVPGCHPVVLCDVVELRNPSWQSAVEGYLDGNRFMLLVEPQYEARAVRAVRAMGGRKAKIAQGEMARKDAEAAGALPADSIVHLLEVTNPTARAYLAGAYGRVVQVPDAETLRHTRRGLTEDGMGSSGYAMYACALGDEDLVFGRSGRERQLKALRGKLSEAEVRRKDLEGLRDDLQALRGLLKRIEVEPLERPAQLLLTIARRIEERRQHIAQLDLTDVAELDKAIVKVEAEGRKETQALEVALRRQGEIKSETKVLIERLPLVLERLESARRDCATFLEGLQGLARAVESYRIEEARARLGDEARSPILTYPAIKESMEANRGAIDNARGQLIKVITTEYNIQAHEHERIALQPVVEAGRLGGWGDYYAWAETISQIRRQLKQQSDIKLAEVTDRLTLAQADVHNSFTAHFCQMLYRAVRDGEQRLKQLNRDLRQHRFSEETYEFFYSWDPKFFRYFSFFEKVINTEGLGESRSLFDNAGLEEADIQVRDELLALLLGEDEEKSKQQLALITDYRNYRHYDILRDTGHGDKTPLSTWGSASGGQFETPSFVVRSAAAASAWRFDDGDTHLRVAVMDETFSKMDERRAKEVLAMLTVTLKLQVIFVIPTMRIGPFHPLATHKLVVAKVAAKQPVGEVPTITIIDEQEINQEATTRLWELHRQTIRNQVIAKHRQVPVQNPMELKP